MTLRLPKDLDGLCFGGDYNPEQWPRAVWREDVALMRDASVNLVTVGVFSWALLEPSPGCYEFGWLDDVLDLLHDGGIKVNLATPTASPPPWFGLAHPDTLPVTADGVCLTHGSRDTYCAAAPAYRAAARNIAGELARRYAGHPALAMWHVHNEYGTTCYCDHAARAFRRWLRSRYDRSLSALNDAWGTAFWSQNYTDWEQVQPPRATQYLPNPHQALDFRRFWSDELLSAYCEQRDILRLTTPDVPVTTNFAFGSWVPIDHARWAAEVDIIAIDCYPPRADADAFTAFFSDLARSWANSTGRPWLLMEQAPSTLHDGGVQVAKEPGRMTRHTLSSVARGSCGAMFFQWRASASGAEQFHSALVPHAGPRSQVFDEARELGSVLARLAEMSTGAVDADVGIAWDAQSWWALGMPHLPSPRLDYLEAVRRAHRTLWRSGVATDFVDLRGSLSEYRLVLVPSHYLASDDVAASVERYVAGGGHLVVWYFSGIADEYGRVHIGGYPGAFRDVLGVVVSAFHPLAEPDEVRLTSGATAQIWTEDVRLNGASPVDHYADGTLAGSPAVTRHRHGDGVAWYVSCDLDDDSYAALLRDVVAECDARRVLDSVPADVELVRRTTWSASWLFALNHGTNAAGVTVSGVDVLTGDRVTAPVRVPPGGWRVIRTPPTENSG
jgi:beta-galactosidase